MGRKGRGGKRSVGESDLERRGMGGREEGGGGGIRIDQPQPSLIG
jgi:hypothetical protein